MTKKLELARYTYFFPRFDLESINIHLLEVAKESLNHGTIKSIRA
jgi:hypothetical protein